MHCKRIGFSYKEYIGELQWFFFLWMNAAVTVVAAETALCVCLDLLYIIIIIIFFCSCCTHISLMCVYAKKYQLPSTLSCHELCIENSNIFPINEKCWKPCENRIHGIYFTIYILFFAFILSFYPSKGIVSICVNVGWAASFSRFPLFFRNRYSDMAIFIEDFATCTSPKYNVLNTPSNLHFFFLFLYFLSLYVLPLTTTTTTQKKNDSRKNVNVPENCECQIEDEWRIKKNTRWITKKKNEAKNSQTMQRFVEERKSHS